MRSKTELLRYQAELSGTRDYTLAENLQRLIDGDETVRATVESALDQVDADAARYTAE